MKDPAVLFYINDWLTSTAEMDADVRGWYLNLLLHNYDKKSLPNDIEKLAILAGVKFSEFDRFKQVFEQVFKHKFEQNSEQRLSNPRTNEILRNREMFLDKRSSAGKLSYFLKYLRSKHGAELRKKGFEKFVKDNIDFTDVDLKNEQMLEHLFEHLFELYRNGNESNNVGISNDTNIEKNWKNDFGIYSRECLDGLKAVLKDNEFMKTVQIVHSNLNIEKTLFNAYDSYWKTEEAWNKKKKEKIEKINWYSTYRNATNIRTNQIYYTKEELNNLANK